jgi:anti-anti-sigma factor
MSIQDPLSAGRLTPECGPMLTVTLTQHESADVLGVTGDVDAASAHELDTAITDALRHPRPRRHLVVIDLDRVGFFAAAGLHVLLTAQQRCGCELELRVVTRDELTLRMLRLLCLEEELPAYPTLDEACAR